MADKYPCPCCGFLVFDESPGSFDICPICFWEDDIVQLAFPHLQGGANKQSLYESQQSFLRIGAVEPRLVEHIRKPTDADVQDPGWRPFDPKHDPCLDTENREDHNRWQTVKDKCSPVSLYYWRPDYWLAHQ
ncbi:MAG: hypothetical protein HZA50_13540 [Planctomycetes bacterium]|nr:hypothetical protein [Planctomycetota bacterium]